MRRSAFHLLLLLVITLATLTVPGVQPLFAQQSPEVPATSEQPLAPDFVPGQLIIRFQPTLTPDEIQAFYQEYGLTEMDDLDLGRGTTVEVGLCAGGCQPDID